MSAAADLLRRAAAELRLLEDAGCVPVARRQLAVALADWLDDEASATPAGADDWPSVRVARAILQERP